MVLSEGILYKILYKIYKNANIVEWIIFIMKKRVFWKHFEADSRSFLLLIFVFVNGTCERCSVFVWKYGKILVSCLKHAVNGKCYYFGGAIILKKALRPKLQDVCRNEEDMLLYGLKTLVLTEDRTDFLIVLWNKN